MHTTVVKTDLFVPRQPGQPQLVGFLVTLPGRHQVAVAALDAEAAVAVARRVAR